MRTDCHSSTKLPGRPLGRPGNGSGAGGQRAFSLVEILVVVTLLTIIMIGLLAMFNQTQKALLAGTTQSDYLESGRAATEEIAREIEQMAPSNVGFTNGSAINFFSYVSLPANATTAGFWVPMAEPDEFRLNVFQQMFFLSRYNQQWKGIGYFVDTSDIPATQGANYIDSRPFGVGALYRYETNAAAQYPASSIYNLGNGYLRGPWLADKNYLRAPTNGVTITKLVDGVVHFRVRAYDLNGYLITQPHTNFNIIDPRTRTPVVDINVQSNYFQSPKMVPAVDFYYSFASNAVPAYLEVELGVLESRTLNRFNALTNNAANAADFLASHGAQIHLFRKRIAIRNVDPVAYQ